jgi:outer membrane receptor protein involved in Fe transport
LKGRGAAAWVLALALAPSLAPKAAIAQSSPPAGQQQTPPSQGQKSSTTTVQTVTVTAGPEPVRSSIDRRSYDISKDLSVQNGASVADALRNVPSVDVDMDGKVTLRGQPGVKIMVDGKPAPMYSGQGGGQALLQVPADQYERVEVMTNPSAAFSPDGSGGVINLISKKHHPLGSFGGVRVSAADEGRYRGGFNASIRRGKVTVVMGAGTGHDVQPRTSGGVIQAFSSAGALETTNTTHGANTNRSTFEYGYGTVIWDVAPKTQLFFSANAFHFDSVNRPQNATVLTDGTGAVLRQNEVFERDRFAGPGIHGELKLRREFAGDDHNLTIVLGRDRHDFTGQTAFTQVNETPASADTFQRMDDRTVEVSDNFSGDYVRPMPAGGQLKAGWDINQEDNRQDTAGFLEAPSPDSPDDPSQTDRYHFRRRISAAYLTYQYPIGKLTVLGGLRVEGEHIDIDDITTQFASRSDDVKVYPTLHLAYAVNDDQQLMASYSERIQRPGAQSYDPFVRVNGPFSESRGNPDLAPEQTKDFEASWQLHAGGGFYIATAYYKQSTGGMTDVATDLGGGVLLTTTENLTRSRNAGVELVASGGLGHGLSYNVSGNAYWNQIDGATGIQTATRSQTTVSGRSTLNWQADANDMFQLNVSAKGPTLTPQGFNERGPTVNFGYRRKITPHFTVVVTGQNLFDTGTSKTVYDSPLLRGHTQSDPHNQAVFVGIVLNFGASPRRQQQPDFDYGENQGGPPH